MGRQILNHKPQRHIGVNVPLEDWDKFVFPAMGLCRQTATQFIRDALMAYSKAVLHKFHKIPPQEG
jgi:hypothetical protein